MSAPPKQESAESELADARNLGKFWIKFSVFCGPLRGFLSPIDINLRWWTALGCNTFAFKSFPVSAGNRATPCLQIRQIFKYHSRIIQSFQQIIKTDIVNTSSFFINYIMQLSLSLFPQPFPLLITFEVYPYFICIHIQTVCT